MQLFVKDLTVIDASYLCPKRGMVGHSWLVDVVLIGNLDEQSMVLDFGQVKKRIKAIIDEEVDHKLLVPSDHENTLCTSGDHEMLWLDFETDKGSIHLYSPSQGIALIPGEAITIETVTQYLSEIIKRYLPANVAHLQLTLREEVIHSASYQYTHGLKKHDGNCQRIAHGHRSMIEIWTNATRNHELEQRWANRWSDIYLASVEDKVPPEQLHRSKGAELISDESHDCFSYVSGQGLFELAMPKSSVELIDTDTTVECLADYILATVKREFLVSEHVRVHAYEGVGKGAIATDE
ncbi:6-pyruvoyl trahydropterin synthase family protein [Echinimonas agarilytica]|uniref:6-carboxy-5,6,7,8-tetrahydropterin synthase n=1 Tax=Echinimonas agarilytica TaxID=1215918 RepID=A0AA41W7Q7_9GAMM|nr:6-carboxytetrahydropterin synthase [Echinimonas agarilytica]MCM2679844.1 6-carboxytetrahydropterin synthase [Echinimonas agarilytica]